MKLYTHCTSCKKEISIQSNATTRPNLQMEKGDEFNIQCRNCARVQKRHVNEIRAEVNTNVILIGIGISAIATIVLWMMYGAIGTISISIPLILWYQQMDNVKSFNSYRIRRR